MRNSCVFICLLGIAAGAAAEDYEVLLETTLGDIVIDLNYDAAPITVDNFKGYVNDGFYDGLIFHRVTNLPPVIQAGGYDADLTYQTPTRDPIVNESNNGQSNLQYTIAMARSSEPDSATSQFYINTADNLFLDYVNTSNPGYCVFGEVVSGMEVVDAIAQVSTHSTNGMLDVPQDPVIIESATVIPEPATIILLGLGGMLFVRRRRR